MATSLGGIPVRNTSDLITPDTKLCMLIYAMAKMGKTTLAAGLDALTKKHCGKPSLIIACEPADGGGTMSIQELGVDFAQPRDLNDLEKIIAALETDTKYAGVILDSGTEVVKAFVQPYALKFASKMRDPRREAGVPARDDYQTMGEEMRKKVNRLVRLTSHPDLRVRKHLIMTALIKEKYDQDGNVVLRIGPDLPGAMADTSTAMFQTVATLKIKDTVVKDPKTNAVSRIKSRVLVTEGDGVWVLGDRTHCFPKECEPDLMKIWETGFMPKFAKKEQPVAVAAIAA